jgi:hypothetical protein
MQKFKLSWMALLRNDEHAQLIEQLCGILDDRPIENPYVTKAAAKVKSHLPALRCVGSESRKHELTAVLEELSEKRRRTLISLNNANRRPKKKEDKIKIGDKRGQYTHEIRKEKKDSMFFYYVVFDVGNCRKCASNLSCVCSIYRSKR